MKLALTDKFPQSAVVVRVLTVGKQNEWAIQI
jgi:hypothetical protein